MIGDVSDIRNEHKNIHTVRRWVFNKSGGEAYGKQCKAQLCKSIENDEKRQSVRSFESGCEENGGKAAENPGGRKTVDSKRTAPYERNIRRQRGIGRTN